jgi:nucleotide sugar dehydrogenase
MKIGIVGLGAVGSAVKQGFEYIGHEVVGHDVKLNTQLSDVLDTEIVYICVGTPSDENGKCYLGAVDATISGLSNLNYNGIVAIKSTIEPTTTDIYLTRYPHLNICFVPEFLRERCAFEDFVHNNNILIVGTDSDVVYNVVCDTHGTLPVHKMKVKPIEAELVKYFSNTYKAMRVTFANTFGKIAEELGGNYDVIKDAFLFHGIQEGHYLNVNQTFGGYGGMCLPKDVKAMNELVKKHNLDLGIFEFMDKENNKFQKKVPKGMRL